MSALRQTVEQPCELTVSQRVNRTDTNEHRASLPLEGSAAGRLVILLRHNAYRGDGDNREGT